MNGRRKEVPMQRMINISTISPLSCLFITVLLIIFLPFLLVAAVIFAILWKFFGVRLPAAGVFNSWKRPSPQQRPSPSNYRKEAPPASEDIIDVEAREVRSETPTLPR